MVMSAMRSTSVVLRKQTGITCLARNSSTHTGTGNKSFHDTIRICPQLTKIDPLDTLTKNSPKFHDLVRDYKAKHFIFGTLSDSIFPWDAYICHTDDEPQKTVLWSVLHLDKPGKWPHLINIAGTLHGGAIATIVDGIAGILFAVTGHQGMTASLTSNYRHPIPLPTTVLCKAYVEKIIDRKVYITVSITNGDERFGFIDEQDDKVEYVRGDTLFIKFKEKTDLTE
jgi:acyl-coenzyme A thioesterase PaaI-like protein